MPLPFKYIVEYGSYMSAAYFAEPLNTAEWRAVPLDGTVITLYDNNGIQANNLTVTTTALKITDLSDDIAFMEQANAIGWGILRYNFVRIDIDNITGTVIDWFDPDLMFGETVSVLGEFSSLADMKGVWFNAEPYTQMWNYSTMPESGSHTFGEYETKVKEVARFVMERWLTANPNMQIITTFAYLAYVGDPVGYGLYKAWLDEWHVVIGEFLATSQEGCKCLCSPNNTEAKAKLILTNEIGYGCLTIACINEITTKTNGDAGVQYQGPSPYFPMVDLFGSAMWVTKPPFAFATPSTNYYSPTMMKDVLKKWAYAGLDMFWMYTDTYTWFGTAHPRLPQEYFDKMIELREELGLPLPV